MGSTSTKLHVHMESASSVLLIQTYGVADGYQSIRRRMIAVTCDVRGVVTNHFTTIL